MRYTAFSISMAMMISIGTAFASETPKIHVPTSVISVPAELLELPGHSFDVFGLKLGMSVDDVKAVLTPLGYKVYEDQKITPQIRGLGPNRERVLYLGEEYTKLLTLAKVTTESYDTISLFFTNSFGGNRAWSISRGIEFKSLDVAPLAADAEKAIFDKYGATKNVFTSYQASQAGPVISWREFCWWPGDVIKKERCDDGNDLHVFAKVFRSGDFGVVIKTEMSNRGLRILADEAWKNAAAELSKNPPAVEGAPVPKL